MNPLHPARQLGEAALKDHGELKAQKSLVARNNDACLGKHLPDFVMDRRGRTARAARVLRGCRGWDDAGFLGVVYGIPSFGFAWLLVSQVDLVSHEDWAVPKNTGEKCKRQTKNC